MTAKKQAAEYPSLAEIKKTLETALDECGVGLSQDELTAVAQALRSSWGKS